MKKPRQEPGLFWVPLQATNAYTLKHTLLQPSALLVVSVSAFASFRVGG